MTLHISKAGFAASVVFLLGCLGSPRLGAEGDEAPPLGEAEVRALLEEASAMPRAVLDEVVRMGAMVRPEDLAALGNLPLTQLVLVLPAELWRAKRGESVDIRMDPTLTPSDIRDLLRFGQATKAAGYSLLRTDAITHMTLEVTGRSARGTVEFRHGESIEGTLEWTAMVEEGRWRVLSLWGPHGQRGVVWRRGQWNYAVRRSGRMRGVAPDILTPAHLAIPTESLPVLGLVGDVLGESPAGGIAAFHVAVTPRGRILLPAGVVGLGGLRTALAEDRSSVVLTQELGSRRNVVLRVGRETPWHVVGWTLTTLRPGEEDATVHLYVAAKAEGRSIWDEQGAFAGEGVMALGTSRALGPDEAAPLDLVIEADEGEVPSPSAFRVLKEVLAAGPPRARRVRIEVGSEGRVRSGHVFAIADLALRAGARDIDFVPTRPPPVPEGGDSKPDFVVPMDHTEGNPPLAPGFRLRVGATALRGDPPIPPVRRASWEPAGADVTRR